MHRVLLAATLAIAAGCQTQSPFAAIGPATVPAPTTGQQTPYYPATAAATPGSAPNTAAPATPPNGRISVSAENSPRLSSSSNGIVAEPADREPIRIVESGSPGIRTATAPMRGAAAGSLPTIPTAGAPSGTVSPPPNRIPTGQPSGYAPPAPSPAASRMRGFAVAPAAPGLTSAQQVAPAAYQQAVPTFSEIPAAPGQWRAR